MSSVTPVIPITFAVIHNDGPADVTLDFSTNADVLSSTRWRVPAVDDAALRARGADAREFALLAAKRWRHYRDTNTAAHSLADLRQKISDDPAGEYCFHFKVTADWFPASLGGVMARRTWCHHLVIDFLFVHPQICSRFVNIQSVGINLLRAVCLVAEAIGCKRIWGEATEDSSRFYQKQIQAPVDDLFILDQRIIRQMARSLDAKRRIA